VTQDRKLWIDHVKAWAIIAVIFTHARRAPWEPAYGIWDFLLGQAWTAFHVPSFLFVSGFLYATTQPVGVAEIGRRATRILVPYVVASTLALVVLAHPARRSLGDAGFALLTGSASPFYYYIFVLCISLPLIWPLSRMSGTGLVGACSVMLGLTVARVIAQEDAPAGSPQAFWGMRDPVLWFAWGWFTLGWTAAVCETRIEEFTERHPRALRLLVGLALLAWVALLVRANYPALARNPIGQLDGVRLAGRIAFTLAVIAWFALVRTNLSDGAWVQLLSSSTLMVYLAHPFFLHFASPWVETWSPPLRILTLAGAMTLGCVAAVLLARTLLGARWSRHLLGA
jgi:fucose 4-O-acetylase-like acetyltransferase